MTNFLRKAIFKDDKLILYVDNEGTEPLTVREYVIDENSNIILKESAMKYIEISEDNIAYLYPGKYALLDENGNEIIPFSEYCLLSGDSFAENKTEFIFAVYDNFEIEGGEYKARIYDKNGKLLLDDIFGIPSYLTLPNGGIVVYTSADKCYILMPNGNLVPVKGAPSVTREYGYG